MMKPRLMVRLLGEFWITYDNRPLDNFPSARLQSLIAYLILHHDVLQPRRSLAYRLWPDSSEASARNNLRQLIYQLRQVLPDPDRFLAGDGSSLGWKLDDDQIIDVVTFESALEQAQAAANHKNIDLERYHLEIAIQSFHGDLLPGCYDEWTGPERERVHSSALTSLQKLMALQDQQRDYDKAIHTAQSMLLLDPLDENTHLQLMNLHLNNQDRAGAIRVYQNAAEVLKRELGVNPGSVLQDAYHRILQPFNAETTDSPETNRMRPDNLSDIYTLVGRRAEWQQMLNAWQRASHGSVEMVVISGEAGIGKSRLAEELVLWAERQGIITARARAYDVEGRLSLAPVTEWLHNSHFSTRIQSLDPIWRMEVSRLIPELRAQDPNLSKPEPITEYGQRQRFFEALTHAILIPKTPTILLMDDLQWCDQETMEWLHFLIRSDPLRPLLILATVRREEMQPPLNHLIQQLRASRNLTEIELQPLDASETTKLAGQTAGKELELTVAMRLYQESEGNPLYVIEMVHAGFQDRFQKDEAARGGENQSIDLPPRMQAVILQRLSQLSASARRIAEIGAVYGRPFSLDLLIEVEHVDEDSVVGALDELWQKRIIREQSPNHYAFTHDKLREVAFAEVSAPQRRLSNRRIAQALESLYSTNLETVSGQIAAHYDQAGVPEPAVAYYGMAGTLAASVYANDDAIFLLKRGLELVQHIPAGAKRDAQELSLHMAIAPPYRILKGWTASELGEALSRALILCDKVGTPAQRAQVLYGLQSQYVVEAKLEKVQYLYDEMHRLFLQTQGDTPQFAGMMFAGARLHMGQLSESRRAFEGIIATHNPEQIQDLQASQGVNYLAHSNAWYSHGLWLLGFPDSALRCAQDGVRIAGEYAQPFNQALTLTYLAMLQELRADTDTFCAQAEEALALSEEVQATYYRLWAHILVRFAYVDDQPSPQRLADLEDAIQSFKSTGARLRLPYYLSLLARGWLRAGAPDKALTVIENAMSHALNHNERCWDAELHRLRGEILWVQGADLSDVEAAFLRSLEIARTQQALAFELRSATSLARFWISQKRQSEGNKILHPLLDRYTEGLNTPDYQSAQILVS
jgi:DNA-binding SARP family transcriptional activator